MGGGVMRAAGITVANGGLRGITLEHCPVFSATLRAASSRPEASPSQAGVRMTSSEMDDWLFAGREPEPVVSAVDQMPRIVFAGRPTLQEAKEATSDLTVALEKVYLSSHHSSAGFEASFAESRYPCLSVSSSQLIENKASERAVAPAVPAHAIKAFQFLYESSAAQDVVASIACDQNVWNAVLHNQELQEFLQSKRAGLAYSNMNQSSERIDVAYERVESQPDNGFIDVVQKVKTTVVDMISSLSDYFQNFFAGQGASRILAHSGRAGSAETVMGASFMGLAIMAIMVIL
ncbi:hypothetical protein Sango_1320500 [Sesamum angolense]|uniref:Uncharacterized protein n=1 Tax=Sesamum angolense TaxID=2727404 RepID=A0AAE2BUX4_9LAMI|nr:hypothetical protein Sango_1320500 [Sesamum angolense]